MIDSPRLELEGTPRSREGGEGTKRVGRIYNEGKRKRDTDLSLLFGHVLPEN